MWMSQLFIHTKKFDLEIQICEGGLEGVVPEWETEKST